jgi:hypothetical protein
MKIINHDFGGSDDESRTPFLKSSPKMEYQLYRKKRSAQFYGETESHQYEQDENEVYKHHQLQRYSSYLGY